MPFTITKPTAVLNSAIARRNIARMAAKARRSGVLFRPHFKTHQSAAVGEWFRAEGVTAITVSSVGMAEYFAAHGWDDVLVAFPVNWREIDAINALAARIVLGLLVESVESARFLAERLAAPVDVWLKLDTGYHRTGIGWDDAPRLTAVAEAVRGGANMTLRGLLAHAGHTYHVRSEDAIRAIYTETVTRLKAARATLERAGVGGLALSMGDTPCCSVVEDLSAVDEIRPGNFVFYDMMQVALGSCTVADVAVAVACPIVALHLETGRIVIYGGGVHLSKERLARADGTVSFGAVALPEGAGWGAPLVGCYVAELSQEHGIVQATPELLAQTRIGELLYIVPVHSCLTVDLLKRYVTLEGEVLTMMGCPD